MPFSLFSTLWCLDKSVTCKKNFQKLSVLFCLLTRLKTSVSREHIINPPNAICIKWIYNLTFINYSLQIWIAFVFKAYQLLQSLKLKQQSYCHVRKTDIDWLLNLLSGHVAFFVIFSLSSSFISVEKIGRLEILERRGMDGWKSILSSRMCNQMKAEKWL